MEERSSNFHDLLFRGEGDRFELAVECRIPEERLEAVGGEQSFDRVRYEIAVGLSEAEREIRILGETVAFWAPEDAAPSPRDMFPESMIAPDSIFKPDRRKRRKNIIKKTPGGNDNYYSEICDRKKGEGWAPSVRLGPRRSALANLMADEDNFPVSVWLRELLTDGARRIVLNSEAMRRPSPPGQRSEFIPDGSNLPWIAEELRAGRPERFREWVRHVRAALPDIEDIRTVLREEDRHRYLVVHYAGGLRAPSWTVSDGTLRLLALTLPAYLEGLSGVYLVEEPENGIHPRAVEVVCQSLSSIFGAQALVASHSPVVLSNTRPDQVLCFARTDDGAADIVAGDRHPALRDWQGDVDFGVLYASGVLG